MSVKSILRDYQERRQAKKEWKAKNKKIVVPGKEEEVPTKTILEKKIVMNRLVNKTNLNFGVSDARVAEILRKMIAVANIYNKYSVVAEVLLNCSDRFTEMERLFGLFALGRIQGQATMLKQAKINIKFNAATMPLEARLLSIFSKQVLVNDPVLDRLLKEGKDGR